MLAISQYYYHNVARISTIKYVLQYKKLYFFNNFNEKALLLKNCDTCAFVYYFVLVFDRVLAKVVENIIHRHK